MTFPRFLFPQMVSLSKFARNLIEIKYLIAKKTCKNVVGVVRTLMNGCFVQSPQKTAWKQNLADNSTFRHCTAH